MSEQFFRIVRDVQGLIALKAQANCRATLEALVKLHQPREQTVKHVHVRIGVPALMLFSLFGTVSHSGFQIGLVDTMVVPLVSFALGIVTLRRGLTSLL